MTHLQVISDDQDLIKIYNSNEHKKCKKHISIEEMNEIFKLKEDNEAFYFKKINNYFKFFEQNFLGISCSICDAT